MLELHHYGFSTCSQKVRLVLAEKQLDFVSREVDIINGEQHDPAYVRLNPSHVVPTLVHDGAVLLESTLVNEYLDEAFPERPMRPADACGRHAVRLWTRTVDEKVHVAAPVVTFAIGPRPLILQQPRDLREAHIDAIPDPAARAVRRSVIERGVEAPEFAAALRAMVDLLDRADAVLADREWLSGDAFGLADAAALPYVLRLEHLAMDPLLSAAARPSLARWYDRVRARAAWEPAIGRWAPEPVVAMLRANGAAVWPQVAAVVGTG
jgi:glutathione S-transferase